MRKVLILVLMITAVPLLPFLVWNGLVERAVQGWAVDHLGNPGVIASGTVALLTVDLFLPVPSSVVSVFTARALSAAVEPSWLGLALAVGVVWLGTTLGALAAWWLGRLGGERLARRFAGEEEFRTLHRLAERHGAWVLALLRAVPLFAEASVLALSVSGVRFWRVFFWPVALGNLGIALIYGVLGDVGNGLPLWAVFLASILLPAAVSLAARWWLARKD